MTSKITQVVAREVVRLHENQTDPSDIAQQLNLKTAQVTAIIAHSRFQNAQDQSAFPGHEVSGNRESNDREIEEDTDRSTIVRNLSAPLNLSMHLKKRATSPKTKNGTKAFSSAMTPNSRAPSTGIRKTPTRSTIHT